MTQIHMFNHLSKEQTKRLFFLLIFMMLGATKIHGSLCMFCPTRGLNGSFLELEVKILVDRDLIQTFFKDSFPLAFLNNQSKLYRLSQSKMHFSVQKRS